MPHRFLFSRPWIPVQALSLAVMIHACLMLSFVSKPPEIQLPAMGWIFLSLGAFGAVLGLLARHWAGSPVMAWGGVVKLFGSVMLFGLAPSGSREVYVSIALVILVAGLIHVLGALRLRRQEWNYRPFVASGAMNVVIAVVVLTAFQQQLAVVTLPLVAGATFTTGLTLFYYGRFLRRLSESNSSLMERLRNTQVATTRHSKVRL